MVQDKEGNSASAALHTEVCRELRDAKPCQPVRMSLAAAAVRVAAYYKDGWLKDVKRLVTLLNASRIPVAT